VVSRTELDPNEPVAVAGNCHRIALAVHELEPATRWFVETLGATMMPVPEQDGGAGINLAADGALLTILWLHSVPIVLIASTDPDGNVGRFLAANGPSVQSLAWEIPDMWRTENLLRADGMRIVGTDIPGRHFFVHPRDAHGLLLEYTDDELDGDPRRGAPTPSPQGALKVRGVAWVTAVVDDLGAAVERLRYMFGAAVEAGGDIDTRRERGVALAIGDITVRLIMPTDDASAYARGSAGGNNRYHSMTLAVDDFGAAPARLDRLGIAIERSDPGSIWLDRSTTLGIQLELVDSSTVGSR
jgi:catechol 2,3-dioxygenase-like lactoylglutathione lyase family enzyme